MRHLLLALMIVLLPLRGWVGDAMAAQMAAATVVHQLVTVQSGGGHRGGEGVSKHVHLASEAAEHTKAADCAGHTASGDTSSGDTSHCESCVVCQACFSVGLALPSDAAKVTFISLQVPRSVAPRFTSAERALGLKPPIS